MGLQPRRYASRTEVALTTNTHAKLHRWWPFLLLLAAGATRWIVASAHPEAESTLASETLGCGWAALVSFALTYRRDARPAIPNPTRTLLSGAMIFGGPAIALLVGGRVLDAGSLTIALALTPVVVAIAAAALHPGLSDDIAGRLWPGLAAVAGLLLVLAQPNLSDPRTDVALILAPILTGLGAALFTATEPPPQSIPLALTGATALFAIALAIAHPRLSLSLLAIACDGLLALLAALALVRLGATLWSSQFTWLPLLIVLEGLILIRPPLTTRWVVGLTLLAASSVYMLLPAPDDPGRPTLLE